MKSFYDRKTKTLEGKPADLAMYRGKVSLVVNVASKCGYTPQYEGLEKLQKELTGKDFNVLGFPATTSVSRSPAPPRRSSTFCKLNLWCDVPDVLKSGDQRPGRISQPIYEFLGTSGNSRRGISANM